MKIGRLARPQHSGEGLRHAGPASLLDSMTFTSEASLLARQLVRSRSIETPGGRLLDAFVRAPRVASASPAHVVMLGGSLGLAVVCLPDPHVTGLIVVCRYSSGTAVPVQAFGLTRMAMKHPRCFSVLACQVPADDYAAASGKNARLDVELTVDRVNSSASIEHEAGSALSNWTGFVAQLHLSLAPYSAEAHAGSRIALTCMVRNAVRGTERRFKPGSELLEWIEYHRILGVDRFYLYDNGSTDKTRSLLMAYASANVVTPVHWPYRLGGRSNNRAQGPQINHALFAFGHHVTWLGFIDTDEFLAVSPSLLRTPLDDIRPANAVRDAAVCEEALKIIWMGNQLRNVGKGSTCGRHSLHAPRILHCRDMHRSVRSPPKVIISVGSRNVLPTSAFRSVHHFELWKRDAIANPCIHPVAEHQLVLKHFSSRCDCSSGIDPELENLSSQPALNISGPAFCEDDASFDSFQDALLARLEMLGGCSSIVHEKGGEPSLLPDATCIISVQLNMTGPSKVLAGAVQGRLTPLLEDLFDRLPRAPPPHDITA